MYCGSVGGADVAVAAGLLRLAADGAAGDDGVDLHIKRANISIGRERERERENISKRKDV